MIDKILNILSKDKNVFLTLILFNTYVIFASSILIQIVSWFLTDTGIEQLESWIESTLFSFEYTLTFVLVLIEIWFSLVTLLCIGS